MKSFKDTEGREWLVAVNVETVKRVRALTSIDLLDAMNGELFVKLSQDPVLVVDVLYAVCQPQAETRNVTSGSFGTAMAGDAMLEGMDALIDGIADFFPKGRREILHKMNQKMKVAENTMIQQATKNVTELDVEAILQQVLSKSATNLPVSSALTPDPSLSAN